MNTKELEWEVLVFKVDESILSNLEGKLNYEFNEEYQFSLDTKI
jgi:hypothetical protein